MEDIFYKIFYLKKFLLNTIFRFHNVQLDKSVHIRTRTKGGLSSNRDIKTKLIIFILLENLENYFVKVKFSSKNKAFDK
jgi:hypothetical protein